MDERDDQAERAADAAEAPDPRPAGQERAADAEDRRRAVDPWESARGAAREDVVAALAPRARRCPSCGTEAPVAGRRCERCERCGAELVARTPRRRPRLTWLPVVLGLLLLAVAAVPLVGALREDAADEREADARRQAALEARELRRLQEDGRPVRAVGPAARRGEDPLAHRAALVAAAERRITADARARVAAGRLKGDFKGTECGPFPATAARRAAEQAGGTRVGRYDCVAYTSRFEAPSRNGKRRTGLFGSPYWLVVDYPSARLVWCKVTPRAGEGGQSLVSVPVPEPCRDPPGPG